ncbi:MAG: shikimate kinase [Acidobacteriales bacterium]|nr:shikimate kinase [Terriglobales bacterium]
MPVGIVLMGFMGAGKTSVGRALASQLGWPFIDLDEHLEAREGQSVPEIFLRQGEAAFREKESAALVAALERVKSRATVLALGGGTPIAIENLTRIEDSGLLTIYLDAPAEELWSRLRGDSPDRPLRRDRARFRNLNRVRRPVYLRAALTIETGGKQVETVVEEILRRVTSARTRGGPGEDVSP